MSKFGSMGHLSDNFQTGTKQDNRRTENGMLQAAISRAHAHGGSWFTNGEKYDESFDWPNALALYT